MITTKVEQGTVLSMMLNSGQEIVGRLVEMTPTSITLKNVLALAIVPDGRGSGPNSIRIGMAPFMVGIDPGTSLTFKDGTYVTWAESDKNLKDGYLQQTSGLVTGATASAMAANLPNIGESKGKFSLDM